MKGHIDGNRAIQRNFDRIAAIANGMRDALESHDWDSAGRLMREEWTLSPEKYSRHYNSADRPAHSHCAARGQHRREGLRRGRRRLRCVSGGAGR